VRTLALIEVPMAQVVSLKMFREPPSLREGLGVTLSSALGSSSGRPGDGSRRYYRFAGGGPSAGRLLR
jgi:hypothetical protein